MQLDFFLRSILDRFKYPDYKILIIYHSTGAHDEGYRKIRNKYKKITKINFVERQKQIFNFCSYFNTFYSLKNFYLFLSHSYLCNKESDNFKSLLESLLKKTDCEYVMFNTDDSYFYNDVTIPDNIFSLIIANPLNTSYRLYVGENLEGFPDYICREKNYYVWDYYENNSYNHWTYPFAIDGTIYHTRSILDIIGKVPYHNPITLEGYVVEFVKRKRLLKRGIGPITSSLVGTLLNRVSTNSYNPTINLNTDFLNSKFLEDYELELEIPTKIISGNIVPGNVFLIKGNQKISVYRFDQYGQDIQDSFGPEGTKHQE